MTTPNDTAHAGRQIRFQRHPEATEIVLVRHGESKPAVPGDTWEYWERHGNPPLHSVGEAQAELVCRRLATEGVDAICVTPLQRTSQTAARLVEATGLVPHVERDLAELSMGDWEGPQFRAYVRERHPLIVEMEQKRTWSMIPGAEDPAAFAERVVRGIARTAERHRGQRVATFVHGFVIAQALAHAAGSHPFAFNTADNASISRIVVHGDHWTIRSFNDVTHLEGLDID